MPVAPQMRAALRSWKQLDFVAMAPSLPTGTVTLLFTDIEGSTKLLSRLGDRYGEVLAAHHEVIRAACAAHDGREFGTQGDALFVAFSSATSAVRAAVAAQRALADHEWPHDATVRVRMGLHTGEPAAVDDGGYVGIDVHRAARISGAAHGGQVLLSHATRGIVGSNLPPGASLEDLGEHRLKDLDAPEHIHQLLIVGLTADWPPIRSLETPTNLPSNLTPLVGRVQDGEEVKSLLTNPAVRLLTLTGPGGTGKTRLAIKAAAEVLADFPDGFFFVPLAPVRDAHLVASTIAGALRIRETGGQDAAEALADHLRDSRMLLVLDNFEQVLDASAEVASLLARCPHITVLVTSRARLNLQAEQEYAVAPLALPGDEEHVGLEDLGHYEAVRLFIERARKANPHFRIDEDNAPAVAEICRRLDGLPLAIELAAARTRLLTPQAMLGRLGSRLTLLTGGAHDVPEHQRTLRYTLDWSHELLSKEEQSLFARLGVFVGGCTLESIEALCSPGGDIDVLEALSSLVDKSLVRQRPDGRGEARFSLLETIREYACERLEGSGESEAARRGHALHYLELAEQADKELRGPRQMELLGRLEDELGNARAALTWALEDPDRAEIALRYGGALGWFWYTHGQLVEGCRWLEQILALGDGARSLPRARALHIFGVLTEQRNEPKKAREIFEASLAMMREFGSEKQVATSLNSLGVALRTAGDWARTKNVWAEAIALRRRLGDRGGLATSMSNLGVLAMDEGDIDGAARHLSEALAIDEETGDRWGEGVNTLNLAVVALARGNIAEADRLVARSVTLLREIGDKDGLAGCLENAAGACAAKGLYEPAALLAGAAAAVRAEIGAPLNAIDQAHLARYLAPARRNLGDETFFAAREEGGKLSLDQALDLALEQGEVPMPKTTR
ncbi:hypothetical protein BH18ACT15_BH18ACT15_03090 [soil metagenome]